MTDRPATDHRGTNAVTRFAYVLLVYLSRLPRTGVFLGVLVVTVVALFLPGVVGAVLLLLLAAAAAVVIRLTWSSGPVARRPIQVLALAVLVVFAVTKLL